MGGFHLALPVSISFCFYKTLTKVIYLGHNNTVSGFHYLFRYTKNNNNNTFFPRFFPHIFLHAITVLLCVVLDGFPVRGTQGRSCE